MADVQPNDIQQALGGMDYPASKEELIQQAQDNQAGQEVMNFLERIEEGQYESPTDVQEELGRLNDTDTQV